MSVAATNLMDVTLVVFVALCALVFHLQTRRIARGMLAVGGQWAVFLGLVLIALPHAAELYVRFAAAHAPGKVLLVRALNEGHALAALVAAVLIAIGLVLNTRGFADVLRRLRASEQQLEAELEATNKLLEANANMQRATRESELRYRKFFDFTPTPAYLHDGQYIVEANPAAVALYGYGSADEMRGLPVLSLIHPDDQDRFQERLMQMKSEPRTLPYTTDRRVRADGSAVIVEQSGTPFDVEGQTLILAVNRDVTELRATEERLRQSQKMEVVGQLTGGIAHDFNNLLAVVLGNIELVQEMVDPDSPAQDCLHDAQNAVRRGADLTSRLLSFARRQPLSPESLDLVQVVAESVHVMRRSLGEGIEIETLGAGEAWPVMCDRTQLETALLNLVINARDAMDNSGKLTIELANADLSDAQSSAEIDVEPGRYVALSVSDNGCGMLPELVARVFEPFFTTKATGRGTGLGLSMVYGFARQTGGQITVESEAGHGTTFTLFLPVASGADSEAAAEQPQGLANMTGLRVLLLEDEAGLRSLVSTMLTRLGASVADAATGAQAIQVASEQGPFDLLLTDVVLPGELDGYAVAGKILQTDANLHVLYMSGYTDNAVLNRDRLGSEVHFISKPFTRLQLVSAIENAVGNPRAC